MAVNLSIKSVPDEWAQRLRRRAERNHRSLQGELMALLEQAVREESASAQRAAPAARPRGVLSVEDVVRRVDERYARLPQRPHGIPTGAQIVREWRDSRWG